MRETQILGDFGKDIFHHCQTNPVYSGKHFDIATVCRIALAKNTNSVITGSYTENSFWYQQFNLIQIRILGGAQPIVDFDTADVHRLYVTTMKAKNFQDDIPSVLFDNFKYDYVLVFHLTSMQDATENCHYPELVGEPLRLELNFTFPLKHVTQLLVLGNYCFSCK